MTNLIVIPKTTEDTNKVEQFLEKSGYSAEHDEVENYFSFPEEEDTIDALETELESLFIAEDINVVFEQEV